MIDYCAGELSPRYTDVQGAAASSRAMSTADRNFPSGRTPPQRSRYEEMPWKSYYTEMLLQHDSGSEYATSYGTGSASPSPYLAGAGASSSAAAASGGHWISRSPSEEQDEQRDALALCSAVAVSPDLYGGGGAAMKKGEATAISRPVTWTWVLLSTAVFGLCSFALTQPYWLVGGGGRRKETFGVVTYCAQAAAAAANATEERCDTYVGGGGGAAGAGGWRFSVDGVPSLSWRTTLLLYACGCVALGLASAQAAFCLCAPYRHRRRLSLIAGYFQLFAVILLITSLLTYPVGLDAPVVRAACGQSAGVYNGGTCIVGWSYALAITSTALAVFCPVLSHYIESPA